VGDGLNWVQSTNWNYSTIPTIIEFIFVSWFSKYKKNHYKISSVCGGHLTPSKISASNESQLSVSKSKILLVLEHWVRNSNGLFWKFGASSCFAQGSHSQNSPVLGPYPTLLRSTNWIYVSQVAYNPSSKQLWKAISIWDEKLQNLQALTDPFPTNLCKLQHLKNCQIEGCKYSRSLVVLENIVLPICRNAFQWIKLFDTPFIYKKILHQKNKSPGTIQNSMEILENPKPNCFFQVNTTR
jgi:hypothetical protein